MERVPAGIRNILFDLGGVLLDINPMRTINAFRKMGMADLIRPGGWGYNHEVFLKMELGLLSDRRFRDGVRELLPQPVTDQEIDQAWNAMLIGFPEENVRLLQQLENRYRLFLFSNTNDIHVRHFHRLFREKFGSHFSELFVKDYYSSDIHLRKPDTEAFRFVLNDASLTAEETLFIDDLEANTRAAAETGMKAICLKSEMSLANIFRV